MGMETLNSAARAAGFAMAADEAEDRGKLEEIAESDAWRPGEAILLKDIHQQPEKAAPSVTDWVKGAVFGMLGRRAPA